MISPSQRPLPDNTQHSQQTNIHALGGIRTHNRSRRAAVDLRLRPRSYWDRPVNIYLALFYRVTVLYFPPIANCTRSVTELFQNSASNTLALFHCTVHLPLNGTLKS